MARSKGIRNHGIRSTPEWRVFRQQANSALARGITWELSFDGWWAIWQASSGKITELAWCWLEAEHRTTGRDQSEIAREILHEWAEQRHRVAIEAQRLLASEGTSGNVRELQK